MSWGRLVPLLLSCAAAACGNSGSTTVAGAEAGEGARLAASRADALRRAKVWRPPSIPISQANLADNPREGATLQADDEVSCRFLVQPVGGTTPKFNCELTGGDIVKVKYGAVNAELHAEVGATRLLAALGFGADRMFAVRAVRCAGCPRFPFQSLQCLQRTGLKGACFPGGIDYGKTTTIAPAVIERRTPGTAIEAAPTIGWAWYELEQIDAAAGGASRAELDAFRLVAVLLAHWDNKSENQRLICLPGGGRADGGCDAPFALIQDLGASFGPIKLDLRNWRAAPVWSDARSCTVSMKRLPWGGGTFPDRPISEEGRQLLLGLLEQLSERQLRDLFEASGITRYEQISSEARDAGAWVRAFAEKVRQIRDAGPCPTRAAG